MRRCMSLAATICLLIPAITSAQEGAPENGPELPSGFDEPMPLHHDGRGLGPFSRDITTSSHEAQLYFDQGAQLLYAFTPRDAARSFREAWVLDTNVAVVVVDGYAHGGYARAGRAFSFASW